MLLCKVFLNADKYGVRYMTLIADGDSSVYARIREDVSVWGEFVKKAKCANHVCKCLRGNLEKNLFMKIPVIKAKVIFQNQLE